MTYREWESTIFGRGIFRRAPAYAVAYRTASPARRGHSVEFISSREDPRRRPSSFGASSAPHPSVPHSTIIDIVVMLTRIVYRAGEALRRAWS